MIALNKFIFLQMTLTLATEQLDFFTVIAHSLITRDHTILSVFISNASCENHCETTLTLNHCFNEAEIEIIRKKISITMQFYHFYDSL